MKTNADGTKQQPGRDAVVCEEGCVPRRGADLPEGASVWDLGGTPRALVAPAAKILTDDA